jgi:hypothetical protein
LNNDLMQVRRLLGWQATEYDGRIRYGTVPLANLQHGKIMLFTSYTLVGLTLLTSSFFLMLLENYGLQLHHLMPHSLTLVAIFVHLCEMYVIMRPFVRLFQLFFALRDSGRSPNYLGAYYFQGRGKSLAAYIAPLTPGKWDRWREDWVIVKTDAHDWLDLPTDAPTGERSYQERVLDLQSAYDPVVKRIQFLAETGLTSMMVLFDFLSRPIAPLQQPTHAAWLYTKENEATQLERGHETEMDRKVLEAMLSKLSFGPVSEDFVNPPSSCMPICLDQAMRSVLLKDIPTLDDTDVTMR